MLVITGSGACPSSIHAVVPVIPHAPIGLSAGLSLYNQGNETEDATMSSKRDDRRGKMWCWQGRAGEAVSAALTAQLEHAFDPSSGNSEWSS